ncbi:MAG: alpha/beta hydrolase [Saprospiraceae bacterium]|nr:alpha/beta hydrolase [Saprospiraceae bacterium]
MLWIIGNLFTALFQDYFIFLPKKLASNFQFGFTSDFEEIFISTKNNGHIHALWFHTPNETAKKGIVIYNHGNKDNLKRWGHYHYYFKKLGYDFLVYDYRGFGKSTGPASEDNMYTDALAVYKKALDHYPEEKIIVYGRSMGSTFACKMAAAHQPAGLILETPFSGMKDLFYSYYPFFPKIFWFKYTFDNKKLLPEIHCPILIFQGTRDRIVPLSCTKLLQPILKKEDRFIILKNGNHHNLMHFERYGVEVEEFLR